MPPLLQDYSYQKQFQISLILPRGDRLDYLEKCIESICQQQHEGSTEILLLDNAHSETNREELELLFGNYRAYFPKQKYTIHYIKHPQFLEVYANINWGLKLANGQWLYLIHAGDLLLESTLVWFEEIIQQQPNLDLISGGFYQINQFNEILYKSDFLNNKGLVEPRFFEQFFISNPLQPITTIYNKALLEKVGYFNTNLATGADWELLRRVIKVPNLNWYYLPQYVGAARSHITNDQSALSNADVWQILDASERYFSPDEQRISKKNRFSQCFQSMEEYLLAGKVDRALSVGLDLVTFSDLGDRLWLEVLKQQNFKYKQQMYEMISMLMKQVEITTK